jgi:hypothetical protein
VQTKRGGISGLSECQIEITYEYCELAEITSFPKVIACEGEEFNSKEKKTATAIIFFFTMKVYS